MTNLLFVDDEANVLSGLRRMLRGHRQQWTMVFASSGEEALARMNERNFDVVVSDMRMPGMDGAALLGEVQQQWPSTVRIVLSGQSESHRILRAVGPAHQYLSKPCDADKLTSTVTRSCTLRDRLPNQTLKTLVSQLDTVPCRPQALAELQSEVASPDATVQRVAKIIAGDVGMTAKILQLVSSSFFGQPRHVTSGEEAVSLLGIDLLKELIGTANIFREFNVSAFQLFSLDDLTEHSVDVSRCAGHIAQLESDDPHVQGDSQFGGMLHDIGKIVLADCLPVEYENAVKLAQERRITLWQAEMDTFGVSHAEVGSFLLALWGLPVSIHQAVCAYRMPGEQQIDGFSPLTAVHVANILKRKHFSTQIAEETLLYGSEYLATPCFADRLPAWCDAVSSAS